jgi:RNA binding exosome subunit
VRGKIRGEVESFERVMQALTNLLPSQQALAAFSQEFHRELIVGHFDPKMRQSAIEERRRLDSERLLREAAEAIESAKQARDKILKSL